MTMHEEALHTLANRELELEGKFEGVGRELAKSEEQCEKLREERRKLFDAISDLRSARREVDPTFYSVDPSVYIGDGNEEQITGNGDMDWDEKKRAEFMKQQAKILLSGLKSWRQRPA